MRQGGGKEGGALDESESGSEKQIITNMNTGGEKEKRRGEEGR